MERPVLPPVQGITCIEQGCDRPPLDGDARCALHASRLGHEPAVQAPHSIVVAPAEAPAVDLEVRGGQASSRSGWREIALSSGALLLVVPTSLLLVTRTFSEVCAAVFGYSTCHRWPVPPMVLQQVGAWLLALLCLAALALAPWWAFRATRGRATLARVLGWCLLVAGTIALLIAPVLGAALVGYLWNLYR
jgi:hypothetical protein